MIRSKIKSIGRILGGVVGAIFILEVVSMMIKGVLLTFQRDKQEDDDTHLFNHSNTPTDIPPFTVVPSMSTLDMLNQVNERRRLFSSYILSRVERTMLESDPIALYIQELAEYLSIPLEIRTAKIELHQGFPHLLAVAVEEMLSGDVWTEAMEGPAVR